MEKSVHQVLHAANNHSTNHKLVAGPCEMVFLRASLRLEPRLSTSLTRNTVLSACWRYSMVACFEERSKRLYAQRNGDPYITWNTSTHV